MIDTPPKNDAGVQDIAQMPEYKALIKKRYIVAVPLALLILVVYISFILLVAYAPHILAIVMPDGVSTFGIWYGLGIIILTLVITGAYVVYANSTLEQLISDIQAKRG